jgi:flagellar biosynthesis/type III secretory pathway protein FliH
VVLDEVASRDLAARPRRLSNLVGDTFSEAYDRGKRDGRIEGAKASDAAAIALGTAIQGAIDAALVDLRSLQHERVSFLIAEAVAIAEFVVGRELSSDNESLIPRIEAALEALDDEPLTVHVAPQDVEVVGRALGANPTATVSADPELRPGEARVSGPWADADLTMRAAIETAREALT